MGALVTAALWALGLGAAVFVPTRLAYGLGAVGSARRRARGRLVDLKRRLRAAAQREEERQEAWLATARDHAARRAEARLEDLPVESLKAEGANRVRWSALTDAGWNSVAAVSRAHPEALDAAPGVGPETARKVLAAAGAVREREEGRAPGPPQLDDPEVLPLLRGALGAVREDQDVRPRLEGLADGGRALFDRLREVAPASGFVPWLVRPGRRADTAQALRDWCQEADEVARDLDGLVDAETDLATVVGLDDDEIVLHARSSWPQVEATLEETWIHLGLSPSERAPSARGGLPEEIAQRVEAFPLVTEGLDVTLRPYQAFGARYLLAQERVLLGDEMGLGKTIEALAALTHRWNEARGAEPAEGPGGDPAFLIVAPAGLIWNWAREIEARAPFGVEVVHGEDADEELARWSAAGGAAVTSYATLRNLDLAPHLARLGPRFDYLVADEAHYVKNPEARRTQAVARLLERVRFAALLTGTPMENHPEEFLVLAELVQPQVARHLAEGDLALDGRTGDAARFHERAAAIYLRRNQEDVLTELPERLETLEWVDLGPGELRRYRAAVEASNFAELRRATSLTGDGGASAKLERLDELLLEYREVGRKVLVFSFFLEVLEALDQRFEAVGTIRGGVSPEDRMELVDRFGAVEGHALLLLQITAGGTGLNLQAASAVIFVEPQLKPTSEDQATARAHRMGQTQRVLVHRLVARDTVDEHLLAMLGDKRELFAAYARQSALKEASEAATATSEAALASRILELERERLGSG